MGIRKERADNVTVLKIQRSKFHPGRSKWSAHTISRPAPRSIFAVYQLEPLNLAEISTLQGKNIPPVKKKILHNLFSLLYQVTFTYPPYIT